MLSDWWLSLRKRPPKAVTLLPAVAAHLLQLRFEAVDALANATAVGLQLGFARSAGADAATQLRHGLAPARKARQLVLQLRELHLQVALTGAGVSGKDVQNELRAIDDAHGQQVVQVARLRRREVVVEQDQVGTGGGHHGFHLLNLARADQRADLRARSPLGQRGGNVCARGNGKLLELGKRCLKVQVCRESVRRGLIFVQAAGVQ